MVQGGDRPAEWTLWYSSGSRMHSEIEKLPIFMNIFGSSLEKLREYGKDCTVLLYCQYTLRRARQHTMSLYGELHSSVRDMGHP